MESRELRIGNLLLWHGFPYGREVIKIDETSFTVKIDEITNVTVLPNMTNGIKPIPLTEEWLLKFGFKQWGDKYTFGLKGINIHHRQRGFVLRRSVPVIQYVHQLQNLYFALTGEELTLR